MTVRRTPILIILALLTALAICAGPAQSAFPGGNGKIVFASDRTGTQEVWVLSLDGPSISQRALTNAPGDDQYPVWSADGTKIAFSSAREGNDKIYTMNADGSGQTRVTDSALHSDVQPAWSPDGSKIAFRSSRAGEFQIFVVNADGTGSVTQLTSVGANLDPTWSPDGSEILFASDRDGDYEIFVMKADGTNQRQLTFNTAADHLPDPSPSGNTIAFQSDRSGNVEVYLMNPDGTGQSQLTSNPAFDSAPAWSPDGTKLAFQSNRTGNFDVWLLSPDGETQLTAAAGTDRVADWQPLMPGADVTPPVLTAPADITVLATAPPAGEVVTFAAFAFDNVDASPTVTCSPASGSTFPVGSTTVSCIASDASGNWAEDSFTVTVEAPPNTPTGTGVVVEPIDATTGATPVSVTFQEVTTEGLTTLTTSSSGPTPPSGFEVDGVYYELATTAEFDQAEVCFAIVPPSAPIIAHWVGDPPALETPETYYRDAGGEITFPEFGEFACAIVTGFSPFALLVPAAGDDTFPPAVTITTPAEGAVYTKDQDVLADYSCEDEIDGSGLASCDGPVASGAAIATGSVGSHSFSVTGSDNAGNSATLTHTYSVVYCFGGFFSPVDNQPVLNAVQAGRGIPVKFSLCGDQGLAIFDAGYPRSQQVACNASSPVDGIEETVTAGASSLSYDASSDRYSYVWKTERSWKGTCRQLVLKLADGTYHRANFKFQ